MNTSLIIAGLLALSVCLLHVFIGGREIVRPFLAVEHLAPVPRYTMYFCWHLVSLSLAGMAAAFFVAARSGGAGALAGFATLGAASFAVLNFAMNARLGLSFVQHPQGFLFVPVAAFGAAGLWAA